METGRDSGSEDLRPQGLPRGEKPSPSVRPMGRLSANPPSPSSTARDFPGSPSPKVYQPAPQVSSQNEPSSSVSSASQVAAKPSEKYQPRRPQSSGLGGLYFLLATTALMCGIWFIGPRLVQEYHYAATVGKLRGEYDNAVVQLEKQPLHNVSRAYQLVCLLYTSPSPRDGLLSRMPSSA